MHSLRSQTGAVAVFVAVMILPLALLVSFAIDTGHWWVHHRHLQTQVDAGALAGALGPWLPLCNESAIEANARQYSGNLGTGYNPQYTNSTNVHVLLNSKNYWENGGSDFSDTGPPAGGTPCQQLLNAQPNGPPAFLDLKATEANLPNLFGSIPGFSVVPAIDAHARVAIEALQEETGVRPIAVRDDSAYQCAQVMLIPVGGSTPIATVTLPTRTVDPNGLYTQFQNPSGTAVTLPSTVQDLYEQVSLGDCQGNNDVFPQDDSGNTVGGVNFINVYSTSGAGSTPVVQSVSISNGGCGPDQYFSTNACNVTVNATVLFPAGAKNPSVTINGQAAGPGPSNWSASFSVAAKAGPQSYDVAWKYGTNNKGDFGVQQQAYSATNDPTAPSNSGQISLDQIGCTASCGPVGNSTSGANSFPKSTTPTLVFTVRVQGLANSAPGDPPILLRYGVQSSKRTGAVDCGQGTSGGPTLSDTVVNGCPSPVYLWPSGSTCVSPNEVKAPTPIDCVVAVPGNKVGTGIIDGLKTRIGNACNNWNAYKADPANPANAIQSSDPRLVTMIITSPANLQGGGGATGEIPVVTLAQLYVTGYDKHTGNGTGCQNEPYPGTNNNPAVENSSVWGHFLKYVPPSGVGNGKACKINQFGDCVAVLIQ